MGISSLPPSLQSLIPISSISLHLRGNNMSKPRLEGKVALITGGASGIGEAAVRLFAENGALVVIADIQDELGLAVASSVGKDRCAYRHCDVRDEKDVESAVRFAVDTFGALDILFSNAGVMSPDRGLLNLDVADLDRTLAVNVRGMTLAIKHAGRAMVASGTRGAIVCTGSISASIGGMGPAEYTASKHAVVGLVKAAAGELGRHGIRVNCVSPHGVATPLACGFTGSSQEAVEGSVCYMTNLKGVVLKARHVAEAAMFLASDEAAFVSGHNMMVDGGYTVNPVVGGGDADAAESNGH